MSESSAQPPETGSPLFSGRRQGPEGTPDDREADRRPTPRPYAAAAGEDPSRPSAAGARAPGRSGAPSPRRSATGLRLGRWAPWLVTAAVLAVVAAVASTRFTAAPDVELALSGRVAVLPLQNATGEGTWDWAAHGLTEMIAETLVRTPGVEVVAPARLHKVLRARGLDPADGELRERIRIIALELGAELVVDGVLRRRSGRSQSAERGSRIEFRIFDGRGEVAAGEVRGSDPLAAGDELAYSLARGLTTVAEPVRLGRVFARDPFLDRLYAMGLQELRVSGSAAAAPFFEIAVKQRPRFLAARARLAECERSRGATERSREHVLAVLTEAQALGERRLQLWSFQSLGLLAALEGRPREAREQFSQAYSLVLDLGDRFTQAEVLFELARLALGGGDNARAEELFVEMLQVQQAVGDRLGEIDTLLEIGSLQLAGGDLEGARQVLDRARQSARAASDVWTEMRALASLGEVARRDGDLATARDLWGQALRFYGQQGDASRQLLLSHNLADVLLHSREFDRAEDLLHEVTDLAAELDNPTFEAAASLRLAWVLLRTGYPRQARPHLERTLELDRWITDDRRSLQLVIAWMAYEQGNYALAFETQSKAKRQAGKAWTPWDEAFLKAFEKALVSGRRHPLPGEELFSPGLNG